MQPRIIIPLDIRNKIQFIVDNCAMEVSGLGTVVFDKQENAYRVTEILLLDQEVGSAHTDLDDDAVAKACYDMRDCEGELAFWWHSHVSMPTFWSQQDHQTMELIGKNGLCVAVVFNKKEEMRGAIVMSAEGFPSVKVDEVEIVVEFDYAFNQEELLAEIKAKVRPKTYTAPKFSNHTSAYYDHTPKEVQQTILGMPTTKEDVTWEKETRRIALAQWERMSKEERTTYRNFNDYHEDCMWGEGRYY